MADNFAQTVKQQADIVRILGDYIKLRKSGANWVALCPFHKEKSGSFYVYSGTQSYYCFGCHEHGDVFTFVQKMDSLSFPEAVRAVAQKMNIPLPKREFNSPEEARDASLRRQLLDVHEAATQYFEQNLRSPEAARCREYMTQRGLTPETAKTFRIGYAPESFNDMRDRLLKFFPEEVLRASGLFSAKEGDDGSTGPMYSRFRKRLIFPICNEAGKPIAFTGRALETDDKTAKYLNSPGTPLYTKGQVLFNLDKAKAAIKDPKDRNGVLLVEGQMDCITVFASGIQNVIATSGTAFTEHQVRLLGRFTKNAVLNFDADGAGLEAAEKTIGSLIEEGFAVRIVTLEGGKDPDEFIRANGVEEYVRVVRAAKPWIDFMVDRALRQFPARTPEDRVKALNFLLPHIRHIPNDIVRVQVADDIAQKLGIDSARVRQEVKQAAEHRLESVRAAQPRAVSEVERIILSALVLPEADSARQLAAERLGAHPEWFAELPTEAVIDVLVNSCAPDNPLDAAPDDASRALLASALHVSSEVAEAAAADGQAQFRAPSERTSSISQVANAIETLRGQWLDRRSRDLRREMDEANRRGDTETITRLMAEKLRLDRERRG